MVKPDVWGFDSRVVILVLDFGECVIVMPGETRHKRDLRKELASGVGKLRGCFAVGRVNAFGGRRRGLGDVAESVEDVEWRFSVQVDVKGPCGVDTDWIENVLVTFFVVRVEAALLNEDARLGYQFGCFMEIVSYLKFKRLKGEIKQYRCILEETLRDPIPPLQNLSLTSSNVTSPTAPVRISTRSFHDTVSRRPSGVEYTRVQGGTPSRRTGRTAVWPWRKKRSLEDSSVARGR